jgi:hypothetical protein
MHWPPHLHANACSRCLHQSKQAKQATRTPQITQVTQTKQQNNKKKKKKKKMVNATKERKQESDAKPHLVQNWDAHARNNPRHDKEDAAPMHCVKGRERGGGGDWGE